MVANFADREIAMPRAELPAWQEHPHRLALAGNGALVDGAGVLLPAYGYVWLTV